MAHVFWNRVHNDPSRTVIRGRWFWHNQERVWKFLLVLNSNLDTILPLPRFRDISLHPALIVSLSFSVRCCCRDLTIVMQSGTNVFSAIVALTTSHLRHISFTVPSERIVYKLALAAFRCLCGLAPAYLSDVLSSSYRYTVPRLHRLHSASTSAVAVSSTYLRPVDDHAASATWWQHYTNI